MLYYNETPNAPRVMISGYSNKRQSKYYLGGYNHYGVNIISATFKPVSTLEVEALQNFYLSLNEGSEDFYIDLIVSGVKAKYKARFISDLNASYTYSTMAEYKMELEIITDEVEINLIFDGTLSTNPSSGVRNMVDVGTAPTNNGVIYSGRHIYIDYLTMYVDYPVDVNTQSILLFDVDTRTVELVTSFTTATYHRVDKSHSHVLILDALADANDVAYINTQIESMVELWYDVLIPELSFTKANIQGLYIGSELAGDRVYDITDESNATYATIVGYIVACRTTFKNVYFGGQTSRYLTDGYGIVFQLSEGLDLYDGAFLRVPTKPVIDWVTSGAYAQFTVTNNVLTATEVSGTVETYLIADDGSVVVADDDSYLTAD